MVTYSHVRPDASPAFGCDIAILNSRILHAEDYAHHLSADERVMYERLPAQSRKYEWLAGRLAAKYLFLNSIALAREGGRHQPKPTLLRLSSESLRVFSPWLYRQVEVVVTDGGKPALSWCGQASAKSISLSHSDGVSCACLGMGVSAAVDIETAVPRAAAFYRQNFTGAERSWATGNSIRTDWLFTLLWSLKESALKLSWPSAAAGVWDLPKLEIARLPALKFEKFWSSKTISGDFTIFNSIVTENRRSLPVRVAVTGTDNSVLTVINPLEGVLQ